MLWASFPFVNVPGPCLTSSTQRMGGAGGQREEEKSRFKRQRKRARRERERDTPGARSQAAASQAVVRDTEVVKDT